MKYVKKRDLVIIGFLLTTLVLLIFLIYGKNNYVTSEKVEFEFFDYSPENYTYEDELINSEWINKSTFEINASLFLVCGCEKIKKVTYEIKGNELILYYKTFIDNEKLCADCIFPHGIRFRIRDISKEDYGIISVKLHELS
jgi:hypothetical protein